MYAYMLNKKTRSTKQEPFIAYRLRSVFRFSSCSDSAIAPYRVDCAELSQVGLGLGFRCVSGKFIIGVCGGGTP